MKALCVLSLSLAFLMGCSAAATRGAVEPEPEPWTEFSQGRMILSAPLGWSDVTQPREGQGESFSIIELRNQDRQELTILHPHGNSQAAQQAYLSTYMRFAILAAVSEQQPGAFVEDGIQSIAVTDPAEMTSAPGAYMYVVTLQLTNGVTEVSRQVFMFIDPTDESTALLVSTTMPTAEGEEFPAEVFEIVRTLRYAEPASAE